MYMYKKSKIVLQSSKVKYRSRFLYNFLLKNIFKKLNKIKTNMATFDDVAISVVVCVQTKI